MCNFFVDKIVKKENRIEYQYHFDGELSHYIFKEPSLCIEYSEIIEDVPDSICVIPLICDILPIIWVLDASLYIPVLDQTFYDSIEKFKKGYQNMYPKLEFKGSIHVKKLENNNYSTSDKTAAFFSGGLDAVSTVLSHYEEHPDLISLWGSDIDVRNEEAWLNLKSLLVEDAQKLGCKNIFVKTNFRKIVNEGALDKLVVKKAKDLWWHGFQHGIAIISHAAPYAYKYRINHIYIASSFTVGDHVPCASDPTIDNYIAFGSCKVIHDGYNFTRQDKVENVCQKLDQYGLKKEGISIRVCLRPDVADNCCHCEKCYRTIFEIIAEGKDPRTFGFNIDPDFYRRVEKEMKKKLILIHPYHWIRIQERFFENKELLSNRIELKWIFHYNFHNVNKHPMKHIRAYSIKTINRIKKLLRGGYWHAWKN